MQLLPSAISAMFRSFDDGIRLNSSFESDCSTFFSVADSAKGCKDVMNGFTTHFVVWGMYG